MCLPFASLEAEPSQLNQIINQLHQTNGSHLLAARDIQRKRSLAPEFRNGKRSRSTSPTEGDIYDEQQRCIFQVANSPEPQNIGGCLPKKPLPPYGNICAFFFVSRLGL